MDWPSGRLWLYPPAYSTRVIPAASILNAISWTTPVQPGSARLAANLGRSSGGLARRMRRAVLGI